MAKVSDSNWIQIQEILKGRIPYITKQIKDSYPKKDVSGSVQGFTKVNVNCGFVRAEICVGSATMIRIVVRRNGIHSIFVSENKQNAKLVHYAIRPIMDCYDTVVRLLNED